MEGTRNQLFLQISMEIWEYLLDKGITMTREYLPGAINKEADMHSWTIKDSSKWKLNPLVLQNLYKSWWTPDRPLHFTIKFLLTSLGNWIHRAKARMLFKCVGVTQNDVFPLFSLIGRLVHKVLIDWGQLILITPAW